MNSVKVTKHNAQLIRNLKADVNARLMFDFLVQAQRYAAEGDLKMACAAVRNAADFEKDIPNNLRFGA